MAIGEDDGSWLESRRLIVNQLRTMEETIRGLAEKIEKQNDAARERVVVIAAETQQAIGDLKVRIAMLEVSAKIWGGLVGMLAGAITTLILDLAMGHLVK